MSTSKPSHAEAHAARQRRLDQVLAELGMTHADHALFSILGYDIHVPPEELPSDAEREHNPSGNGVSITEEQCRVAMGHCLERGWLQVITEANLAEIARELRSSGILGPVGGLPPVGWKSKSGIRRAD